MLDLGTTFLQSVERSPHALALVDSGVRLTYAQWHEQIGRTVAGLQRLGLGRGDRLLSVLQNRHQAATLHWACQFLGVVIVPLNWRAKADEIDYCLADAEAKAVFFDASSEEATGASGGARALPRIGVGPLEGSDATEEWEALLSGPALVILSLLAAAGLSPADAPPSVAPAAAPVLLSPWPVCAAAGSTEPAGGGLPAFCGEGLLLAPGAKPPLAVMKVIVKSFSRLTPLFACRADDTLTV